MDKQAQVEELRNGISKYYADDLPIELEKHLINEGYTKENLIPLNEQEVINTINAVTHISPVGSKLTLEYAREICEKLGQQPAKIPSDDEILDILITHKETRVTKEFGIMSIVPLGAFKNVSKAIRELMIKANT